MKRAWWVVLVLVAVTGGALLARASDTKSMSSESKSSMGAASMKADAALQAKLEALERKAWEAFKSHDLKSMREVMPEDSWSVDMSGFTDGKQFETMMQDYTVESYALQDFKLIRLDKDAAILAYSSTNTAKYKDQPAPSGPFYCSTAYVIRGGKWMALFHQETLSQSAMSSAAAETNK